MSKNKERVIEVPILARVEGEGALKIEIKNNQIQSLQLKIYEPPRLFEKFLEQRDYSEVLDIVARICGICPVAYQMSATQAIEHCFRMKPSPWVREMRRLFYCGEWIESHSLHIHLLALPDLFGFKNAPEMAKIYPLEVRRGLRLQGIGNAIMRLLGGRSVHPVGARVGGFYKAPSSDAVRSILQKVKDSFEECEGLIRWLATLPLGKNDQDFICVSLFHPEEYPMNEGRIISDQGLDIAIEEFEAHFKEHQTPYSNALHCLLQDRPYLVGPLARLNRNHEHLPGRIKELLQQLGIHFPSKNMHHSILARAVEVYFCLLEAARILENYSLPDLPFTEVKIVPGKGYGCTEAPRGLLWHCFEIDENGFVKSARIVPPTSQNQARIEEDLRLSLQQFGLEKSNDELRNFSELLIRNYDPCISCSTHFLTLDVTRND
ncbi:Ni/Fe hydrogenase subunit alpha [Legionella maceachernii]|uniref:Ni/Fe hydrogenase subunit alpha n=2 Tax=Legionella TaxID=445 RepID=UPI00072FE90D|nr:nickel-dependent hydrogenase large subunit [Legionella maceachernii]